MIFNSSAAGKNKNAGRHAALWTSLALIASVASAAPAGSTAPASASNAAASNATAPASATNATASFSASASAATASASQPLDPTAAARFATLALSCLHREYPNKPAHVMESDADALPPRTLTPAFYGCFDWHSDVHGHWLLVRLARLYPTTAFAAQARAELARSLTAQNIAGEVSFMKRDDQTAFERPYGLAWLLTLSAELRQWNDPQAKQWLSALLPLEAEAAAHRCRHRSRRSARAVRHTLNSTPDATQPPGHSHLRRPPTAE
jgi:hypothetical protein